MERAVKSDLRLIVRKISVSRDQFQVDFLRRRIMKAAPSPAAPKISA